MNNFGVFLVIVICMFQSVQCGFIEAEDVAIDVFNGKIEKENDPAERLRKFNTSWLSSFVSTGRNDRTISFSFNATNQCSNVQICLPSFKEVEKNMTHKSGISNICEMSIIFRPQHGNVIIKNGDEEIRSFVSMDEVKFVANGKDGHRIHLLHDVYKKNAEEKTFDTTIFDGKLVIALTGSKKCGFEMNIDGVSHQTYLLYNKKTRPTKLAVLHFANVITPLFKVEKRVDLLEDVKSMTKTAKSLRNTNYRCYITPKRTSTSVLNQHSIVHVQTKKEKKLNVSSEYERIRLETNQCDWFRIWFTEKDTKWTDYSSRIDSEIDQTIDFFFDKGLAYLPNRDNAVRLLAKAREIGSISIQHEGNGFARIWMGFGVEAPERSIIFHLGVLKNPEYSIYLIRSPKCDAKIMYGMAPAELLDNTNKALTNGVKFGNCDVESISKP